MVIGPWECISTSAAEAAESGHLGSCESSEARIVMREAPSGSDSGSEEGGAEAAGDLTLAPTGIGIAEWGAPRGEVVAAVTEQLGEPVQVHENVDETSPTFDFHVQAGRYYTWEGLTLCFDRDADGLTWYQFSSERYDAATGQFETPDNPHLATPDDIRLGSPSAELFASQGPLEIWTCDHTTLERTVSPADESSEGTLITGLDGYYFTVEGGVVTDISHARGDERDFCY